DRLIVIAQTTRGDEVAGNVSYPNFLDIKAQTNAFENVLAWSDELVNMRTPGAAEGERRFVAFTSGSYFPMIAVQPAAGRFYGELEEKQHLPVVVLSYKLWHDR